MLIQFRNNIKWIYIFLAIILPVILLAAYSYYLLYESFTEKIHKERRSMAVLSSVILKERFDRLIDIGVSVASRVRFRQLICDNQWDEATPILRDVNKSFTFVDRILITDIQGVLKGDIPEALPSVRGDNFSHRDWYKGVSHQWNPYISEIYRRKASPAINVMSVAVPIFPDKDNLKPCGIVVLQVRLDTLFKWSSEISVDEGAISYFVDQYGHVAGHPLYPVHGEVAEYSSVPYVPKVLHGEEGIGYFYNPIEKEEMLVAFQPIPGYGWGVLAQQPVLKTFSARDQNLGIILLIYVVATLSSVLFAYLILMNIIRRKQAEDEAKRKSEALAASNAELEQFSYVVSHDLQEPLRTIKNFTGLLQEQIALNNPENTTHCIGRIEDASVKMKRLITDLLDLSKVGRNINFRETNTGSIIQELLLEMNPSIQGAGADINITSPLPVIFGHESGFRRLMQNLLSNAIKFRKENIPPQIEISATEDAGHYIFSVKDNGKGIDAKEIEKLFNLFYRAPGNVENSGSGLGLAICKKIVAMHHGKIYVESVPGIGSTFYFTIAKDLN